MESFQLYQPKAASQQKKLWKSGPGRLTRDGDAFEKTGLEQITFGSATIYSNRYVHFDIL